MHDDGTHAWIAIVERSRVVHVGNPGNRGRRVTRDFTSSPPSEARGRRRRWRPRRRWNRGWRVRPRWIPPADPARMMLGQWNLGTRGRIFAVGIFTQPLVGGGRRGAAARPDPDPRDPAARRSPPSQVQARAHTRCWGRWHSRRGRRRAGRLGAPRAARVCDGPERSAPRVDPAACPDGAPEPGAGRVSRAETRDVDCGGGPGDATGDGGRAEGRGGGRRRGDRAESPTGAGTGTGTGMKSRHRGRGRGWGRGWRGHRSAGGGEGRGSTAGGGWGDFGAPARGATEEDEEDEEARGHRRGLGARRRRGGGR